jgi:alpha-amylase
MRLRTYRFFDIGVNHHYYDDYQNQYILRRVADKCYLPMNHLLYELIQEFGQRFKVAFSISGVALEQFEKFAPEVIESFKLLANTGAVEFLAETYSHSLASVISKEEFYSQINLQQEKLQSLLGVKPSTAFRNTELIYSDQIGEYVADLGYKVMLAEGAKHILGWKSPHFLYYNVRKPELKLLLKDYQLSDDIAFRFSNREWNQWPLTTEKYVDWLNNIDKNHEVINLFMDYETFGEHQWQETGIFDFMRALPSRIFSHSDYEFANPTELSEILQPVAPLHVPYPTSWADEERDLTAWLGNDLQEDAFNTLYSLRDKVLQTQDPDIFRDWLYLQTSDHFYYMCTKWFSDGDVHKYFNPYGSPYDAYINYMNIVSDFISRIDNILSQQNNIIINDTNKDIEPQKTKTTKQSKQTSVKKSNKKAQKINNIKLTKNQIEKLIKEFNTRELAILSKQLTRDSFDKIVNQLDKKQKEKLEKELQKTLRPRQDTIDKIMNKFNEIIG